MFEHKSNSLLPLKHYALRQLRYVGYAALIILFSLAIGVGGYYCIANLGWVDSLLNASMILGGMGPVDPLPSDAAKLFASFYALYSGIVFLATIAVMTAPALHRVLHVLHLEQGK